MMNRDLLKEAIADAKAVKETAIANAKAALEEAFTPHLRSMLAAKLEEMDRDEEDVEESIKSDDFEDMMEIDGMDEMDGEIEEEFDLNEILMELEKDEMVEAEDEEMEVEDTEIEDEEAEGEMEGEEIDLEDMSEDDLKSFIEDVIADMVSAGELEAGEGLESEMGEEEIEVEGDAEEMMESDLEEMDDVSWKVKSGTSLNPVPYKVGQTTTNEMQGGYDPSEASAAGLENLINGIKKLIQKGGPIAKKVYAELEKLGASAASGMREQSVDPLGEINELKKELQEVNLLNAKLLYTNKIFKEKTLNESQKIKVLKAFDKAGSVKETKLIFETLSEGIAVKSVKSSMMNEIKSSASKTTGILKENRQSILEVDPMVARWQKLAGINKSN